MPKGRKRKPDHLKVVQGTFRPDRANPNAPPPSSEMPVAPDGLTDAERRYFDEVVAQHAGLGLASATYGYTYEMVARRKAEVDAADQAILENGSPYYTTENGMIRAHPAVAQRSEALRHLQSLHAELGLTPASAGKVGGKPKETKGNAFAELG